MTYTNIKATPNGVLYSKSAENVLGLIGKCASEVSRLAVPGIEKESLGNKASKINARELGLRLHQIRKMGRDNVENEKFILVLRSAG